MTLHETAKQIIRQCRACVVRNDKDYDNLVEQVTKHIREVADEAMQERDQLREQIACFEAMKAGVAIRCSDLEKNATKLQEQLRLANEDAERIASYLSSSEYAMDDYMTSSQKDDCLEAIAAHRERMKGEKQ